MISNMLEAASQMLACAHDKNYNAQEFLANVKCAKIVIDKVIEHLGSKTELALVQSFPGRDADSNVKEAVAGLPGPISTPPPSLQIAKAPKKPKQHVDDKYEVVVDHGKLIEIKNLPLDAKVDLNGQVMTHQEAKGKSFQNASIL